MKERINQIRQAEAASHTEAYTSHKLFTPGSWMAKPVKTVLDLLPFYAAYSEFRGLDLGCGIGRNCIAIAQHFRGIPCKIDCIDILQLAIEKLHENAQNYHVPDSINGILSSIDDYIIQPDNYDLILAISALEHVDSKDTFVKKMIEIREGLRSGGIACLITNTDVQEREKVSGVPLPPQFEVNLPTEEMLLLLQKIFTGWHIIKHTVVEQRYDIPRGSLVSDLKTNVVTWVVRKI